MFTLALFAQILAHVLASLVPSVRPAATTRWAAGTTLNAVKNIAGTSMVESPPFAAKQNYLGSHRPHHASQWHSRKGEAGNVKESRAKEIQHKDTAPNESGFEGHVYRNWPLYVGALRTAMTVAKTERKDEQAQRNNAILDRYIAHLRQE